MLARLKFSMRFPWKIYYGTRSAYKDRATHRIIMMIRQDGAKAGSALYATKICYFPPHSNPASRKIHAAKLISHVENQLAGLSICTIKASWGDE